MQRLGIRAASRRRVRWPRRPRPGWWVDVLIWCVNAAGLFWQATDLLLGAGAAVDALGVLLGALTATLLWPSVRRPFAPAPPPRLGVAAALMVVLATYLGVAALGGDR